MNTALERSGAAIHRAKILCLYDLDIDMNNAMEQIPASQWLMARNVCVMTRHGVTGLGMSSTLVSGLAWFCFPYVPGHGLKGQWLSSASHDITGGKGASLTRGHMSSLCLSLKAEPELGPHLENRRTSHPVGSMAKLWMKILLEAEKNSHIIQCPRVSI